MRRGYLVAKGLTRQGKMANVALSLLFCLSVNVIGVSTTTTQVHRAEASTPDRFFLPLGAELEWLTDLSNFLLYLGDQAYLEPWHTLHPPVSIGKANRGRLLFGHKIRSAFGLWVMEPHLKNDK